MPECVILHEPVQAHAVITKTLWPNCKALLMAGHKLAIEVRRAEDAKTDKQRRYYHGYVLKTIAQQAVVNGKRFDLKTWKEHFRAEYLGFKVRTTKNPITGKKVRRRERVSTEDLGVKGYSQLIERVTAFAVTELGVEFQEEWMDPDTGEIFMLSAMKSRGAV